MSEILGLNEVAVRLRNLKRTAPDAAAAALYQEGELVRTESMKRTPVDTGALRASHAVERPQRGLGGDVEVAITVGGPSADYAIHVHENLEARHPVGEAKFLERALNEAIPGLAQRVGKRIERSLR